MSKKVLSMVVALCMALGLISMLPTPVKAASTTAWQDAYADVLNSPQGFYKAYGFEDQSAYNEQKSRFYFSLRDIDKNGIPELIVRWNMGNAGHPEEVYTYSNEIKDLGYIAIHSKFDVSDNPKIPGLFYNIGAYNGYESDGYATIENNKITEEVIFYTDGKQITKNNVTLIAEMKKAKQIPTYSISDENITNVIYNYGKATGITLNKTLITLAKGKTYTLKATIAPTNATTKAVTWTSSNTKVATVDKNGNVKAIGKGTATITATATDGSKVKKTCKVSVK